MPRFISHLHDDVAAARPTAPAPPVTPGSVGQSPSATSFQAGTKGGQRDASGWSVLPPEYRIPERPPSLEEAQAYCARLARRHYENFSVATWFLPARLRLHFYSVYAYCRISDDLGDEVGDPTQSLRLLDEWQAELDATYASLSGLMSSEPRLGRERNDARGRTDSLGDAECTEAARLRAKGAQPYSPATHDPQLATRPRHPVFIALRETIRACQIPKQPFADLLKAFRQDQTVTRYETFDDLLGYCRFSANPVGRLVLFVCGYRDEQRQQLSDYTCTALQLANFWQDVKVDYAKGRIYLPREDLNRFGAMEDDIARGRATPRFLELMRFQVGRAREWFARGLPLAGMVDRELAIDIELFTRGGQEILDAIARRGYDVLKRRPAISKMRKLWLVARAAAKAKLALAVQT